MYKQREIVLVPFPYSNLSSTKRRPVLILSNDECNNSFQDVLVCVIISNIYKDEYSVSLSDQDLEIGFLPETSIIKCHKLFTIEQTQIVKRFSIVSKTKFAEVLFLLEKLVKPS